MPLIYDYLFPAMWLAFMAYWWAASIHVKQTERREPAISQLVRMVLMMAAAALLWLPRVPVRILNRRFLPPGVWSFWSGAANTAAGLLFAVWARHHLGKRLEARKSP